MTLGEKIQKLRKERGLTQQQLCDGSVTRNMLSQIEHGTALPSLGTLQDIAKKLEVPAGYFLLDSDNSNEYTCIENIAGLKELFKNGKYRDCLRECDRLFGEWNNDETAFLRCCASCAQARADLASGSMTSSLMHAKDTARFADQTVYPTLSQRARASLYAAIALNPLSPLLSLDSDNYLDLENETADTDLYHYICDEISYNYRNTAMNKHMAARKIMQTGDYEKAYRLMEEIEENRSAQSTGAFVMFRVYADMETCSRNNRDFENAYRLSTKRMSLLSAFKT